MKNINYKQLILIIAIIFLITIGISFAYFTATINGEEGTTITVTGGKMTIHLDGGNSINVSNIIPDDNPIRTKTFTITGNNTTELDMGYSLYLVVEENTFSNYAIQYKLISENTDASGTIIEGNEELIGLKTGASETLFGYGTFDSPTVGTKVHSYDLEIYFPSQRFNQNEDQEKSFKAHIKIEDYILEGELLISSLDQNEKISNANMYKYFSDRLEEEYNNNQKLLSQSEKTELQNIKNYYKSLSDSLWAELQVQTTFLNTTILKNAIESIEFVETNIVPAEVLGSFDVSEKQNASIMLWYETGITEGLYKITIGQNGGVKAPIHSDYLFAGLNNLSSLLGDLITSDTKTMSYMFQSTGYNADTFELDLTNWDTSKVTNMSSMFYNAGWSATSWSLNGLNDWDTTSVTDMSGMFAMERWLDYVNFIERGQKAEIYNLDLSDWDTSNVTNMSRMFDSAGHSSQTFELNLSNWNTSKVVSMSNMLESAGFLSNTFSLIGLSGWNTSNVINMSRMFGAIGGYAPTWSIGNLSNWVTSNVIDMTSMFSSAGRFATTWNIGNIGNWDVSNVTKMTNMFDCAGYSADVFELDLSGWNHSKVTNMNRMFYQAGYNADIVELNLDSWDTSKVTQMDYMFTDFGKNSSTFVLNVSNWNTSRVTDMGSMFARAGYSATTWSIGDISSWDTSNVIYMSNMFDYAGYSAGTFILDLSSWDTSNLTTMSWMFRQAGYNATTWSVGDISSWDTGNLSHSACDAITNLNATALASLTTARTNWGCS